MVDILQSCHDEYDCLVCHSHVMISMTARHVLLSLTVTSLSPLYPLPLFPHPHPYPPQSHTPPTLTLLPTHCPPHTHTLTLHTHPTHPAHTTHPTHSPHSPRTPRPLRRCESRQSEATQPWPQPLSITPCSTFTQLRWRKCGAHNICPLYSFKCCRR